MIQLSGGAESCWVADAPSTNYPALTGRRSFDVAIVGGGIAGLTAAIELASAGRQVAVVEALRIGRQVTGRSTAKITTQHSLIYDHLTETRGRDAAKLYADANARGCAWIGDAINRHRIACDYETANAFAYIDATRDRLPEIEAEAEAALAVGLLADVVDRTPLPFPTGGALRFSDQAQFNPARYLIGLAAAAKAAGVAVFEQSRVTAVEEDARWTVRSETGEITARDVFIATHIPMAGDDDFTGRTQPRCHTAMAFPIKQADAPEGMFIGLDDPTVSIRTGRQGDQLLLIVLGARFETGHDGDVAQHFRRLRDWTSEHFAVGEPAWRWTNEDYETADRVPFIGAPGKRGFYIATGFNAWGISNGTAAGILISDLIQGRANDWAKLFDPKRRYPDDFNKGGDSQSKVKRVEDIAAGEGGLITQGDETLAVWRDDAGELHAVCAACTHQGCEVTWNTADRTWDCPCHGSVFAADGSVIHGPAVKPLEPREVPAG